MGCRTFAFFLLCLPSVAVAADEPPKYPVETAEFVLTIKSEGRPVKDATVRLYACRCEEDPGSHYGWPSVNTDAATELTSDDQGKITVTWPLKFGLPDNWKTTSQISMSINHPEFVPEQLHIDPRQKTAVKEINAGCELTFSAVDSDRQALQIGVLMAGPGGAAMWLRDEGGVVRSRAIPDGSWQAMLVSPKEDGRHLFSGVLPVRLANRQDVKIRNLRLRPGLRIVGKLSDDVPRPVTAGRVQVRCIPKPAGTQWEEADPSVVWMDVAKVAEDGTFELLSLPRTGQIQLIAICSGWLGINQGERNEIFRRTQGMILDLDDLAIEHDVYEDLIIPMEPTGTINVTVLKPDGKPLPGAQVSTNPNQIWLLGGSTIVGSYQRSIESIQAQIDKVDQVRANRPKQAVPKYVARTDQNGTATLSGIPLKQNQTVDAMHDDYTLPFDQNGRRQGVPYRCETSDPLAVTVRMQARKE